jgi:hypothetical protein
VLRVVVEAVGGFPGFLARLCVEQVGRRDIGQRLSDIHGVRVEVAGCSPIEVQRTKATFTVAQREGEDGG